ncbi:OmpA family protein [Devosia sp. ZW T5_3]|uniref:OmpA family protein n=1 Tax=Devosia sp. ZW T5_3 TaxID=3378085 RepID=UPI0038537537
MIRGIIVGLILAMPTTAWAYTVTIGAGSLSDQPGRFVEFDLGRSSFTERPIDSAASTASEGSTFGLVDMDSETRLATEQSLTALGAKKEGDNIVVTLAGDVLFDFDKYDIREDARPVLSQLADVLSAMPDAAVTIVGHTDSMGSDDYNQNLSEDRANSAQTWLADAGVPSPMTITGKGETSPVAPNEQADGSDNPEGRQQNRRVEFIIGKQQ